MRLLDLLSICQDHTPTSPGDAEQVFVEHVWEWVHPEDRPIFEQAVHDQDEQAMRTILGKYGLMASPHMEQVAAMKPWVKAR